MSGRAARLLRGLAAGGLTLLALPSLALGAASWQRAVGESARVFSRRVLAITSDTYDDALEARWNGRATIFASYLHPAMGGGSDRRLVLLEKTASGAYRKVDVTTGEQEGAEARIAAIGFANADHDAAQELIVILSWDQQHYDVGGTLYEVRIFDDAKAADRLTYLKAISAHFGGDCDCSWRDGRTNHFRFKTIAAVKAELRRMKY